LKSPPGDSADFTAIVSDGQKGVHPSKSPLVSGVAFTGDFQGGRAPLNPSGENTRLPSPLARGSGGKG
jgi:hypothetical protein